jgi:hypothetical protein
MIKSTSITANTTYIVVNKTLPIPPTYAYIYSTVNRKNYITNYINVLKIAHFDDYSTHVHIKTLLCTTAITPHTSSIN